MPTIAAPADRRFRRAQMRPAQSRRLSARQWWLVARVVAVLAVMLFAGWRGTRLVLDSRLLAVSDVRVDGHHWLSLGEVQGLVHGLEGQNILTVSLDSWRARLLASPWVEDAALHRTLPGRIEIVIRERQPIGIARLASRLYLVDPSGVVIDEYGPNYAELDLPIIDGLAAGPGTQPGLVDHTRAALAARVISAFAARPDMAARVSQIDVADAHDAVVMLDGETVRLRLGEDQFVDRLQVYLDLAPTLTERLAAIDYVDLRFGDRLYVRPAK